MSSSCSALLLSYCSHLQEWENAVTSGAAALQMLQQCFSRLQPAGGTQQAPKVLERLQNLVPSFRLASYISNLQHPAVTPDPSLAVDLHEAHAALRSAVSAAAQQLQQLQDIAEQYTDAALAVQLETGLSTLDPCEQVHSLTSDNRGEQPAEALGDSAAAAAVVQADAQPPAEPAAASVEDVALLLSAATIGMQKDMHLMEVASASITIESTPADLETIGTLWQLQPFTDEQALAAIKQHAAATADEPAS